MWHRLGTAWLAMCVGMVTLAHAQDDAGSEGQLEPKGLRARVGAVAHFSDNFYNQPRNQSSGWGTLLAPGITYVKQSTKLELESGLEAEYGLFSLPGSKDDFLDYGVRLKLATQPTLRNHFRLDGSYRHGHDPFGVDRTEDATAVDTDLDEWNRAQGALHYRYGAPGAMLNAEVGVGGLDKTYTTNRSATEPLGYDQTTFDYALFYNYSSKTAALIDFSRSDFEFERPLGVVDLRAGELYRARVGVKWLATGKTSGDVRVGYRRRLFDSGSPNLEGVDWEAGVDWQPVPRTSLRLETARSEQESYRAEARVIDIRSLSLDWKYNVTARTRATSRLAHVEANFDTSPRDDTLLDASVGVEHLVLSYLWAVGSLGYVTRDSSVADREYDRLNAFVGVRLGR
jgi:hypothetical protein